MKKRWIVNMFLVACMVTIMPMTVYAGAMLEIDGVKAYLPSNDQDLPNFAQQCEIEAAARAYQTYGDVYQADVFSLALLKKGTKICAMIPYQSVFYTDMDTVEAAENDQTLNRKLQIKPNPRYGAREGFAIYELQMDLWVASGVCMNNPAFGEGGGKQYIIPLLIKQQDLYCNNPAILKSWRIAQEKAA